jgi:hypothetical protein
MNVRSREAAEKPRGSCGYTRDTIENTKLSPKTKVENNIHAAMTILSPTLIVANTSNAPLSSSPRPKGILKNPATPKDKVHSDTKRSRKVRFHQGNNTNNKRTAEMNLQVIPIDMIKSQRMKSRLWYTSRDISMMLERDATILSLMDLGYTDETLVKADSEAALLLSKYTAKEMEEITTRGLERQTNNGIKKFQMASRASINAVLQCQYKHRTMHNYYRMECIAAAYALTTQESQQLSYRRAKQDAKYVRDHCNIQTCTMEILRQLQNKSPKLHNINHNKKSFTTTTTSLFSLFHRPTSNATMGQ